jgi:dUTP pyrophosphatase
MTIKVAVTLAPGARLPERMTEGAAADDLYAAEDKWLPPFWWPRPARLVDTGLRMAIPHQWEGEIRPRSSMAIGGIEIPNAPATIDSDYRGPVKVPLINRGLLPRRIRQGQRIAQLLIKPAFAVEYDAVSALEATERGPGGFGSTGK